MIGMMIKRKECWNTTKSDRDKTKNTNTRNKRKKLVKYISLSLAFSLSVVQWITMLSISMWHNNRIIIAVYKNWYYTPEFWCLNICYSELCFHSRILIAREVFRTSEGVRALMCARATHVCINWMQTFRDFSPS